jgi:hypothetical protein
MRLVDAHASQPIACSKKINRTEGVEPKLNAYLKRSSNALRALDGASGCDDDCERVSRSMVTRGANKSQLFRTSLGATRAGMI